MSDNDTVVPFDSMVKSSVGELPSLPADSIWRIVVEECWKIMDLYSVHNNLVLVASMLSEKGIRSRTFWKAMEISNGFLKFGAEKVDGVYEMVERLPPHDSSWSYFPPTETGLYLVAGRNMDGDLVKAQYMRLQRFAGALILDDHTDIPAKDEWFTTGPMRGLPRFLPGTMFLKIEIPTLPGNNKWRDHAVEAGGND